MYVYVSYSRSNQILIISPCLSVKSHEMFGFVPQLLKRLAKVVFHAQILAGFFHLITTPH
jgi:hypothetical protein